MSDEKKPDPLDDLKKGFGLLFRAAKGAVDNLPADKLEEIVVSGVKEVGRAIESVTDQIDRQVFGGKGTIHHPESPATPPKGDEPVATPPAAEAKAEPAKEEPPKEEPPKDDAPKGPRVG